MCSQVKVEKEVKRAAEVMRPTSRSTAGFANSVKWQASCTRK
jgi:hypothetical protein